MWSSSLVWYLIFAIYFKHKCIPMCVFQRSSHLSHQHKKNRWLNKFMMIKTTFYFCRVFGCLGDKQNLVLIYAHPLSKITLHSNLTKVCQWAIIHLKIWQKKLRASSMSYPLEASKPVTSQLLVVPTTAGTTG